MIRLLGGRALLLTSSQLISGFATLATFLVVARKIGPDGFATFGVLWSSTYLVAQLLFVAPQFGMIRFVSDYEARGKRPMGAISTLLKGQLALTVIFALVAGALSSVLLENLFEGSVSVMLAFVTAVVLYSVTSIVRSALMGLSLVGATAVVLALETVFRLLVAVVLLYVLDAGIVGAAASVVAGAAASLLILPVAYGTVSGRLRGGEPEHLAPSRALVFLLPTFVVVGAQQVLLNSPALVLQLSGEVPRTLLASFYAGLVLTRVPQYLLSPLVAFTLPDFTASATLEDASRFKRQLALAALLCLGLTAGMALGFWALGQFALQVLMGPQYLLGRSHLALLAAGVGLYVLADVLHLAMVARGRVFVSAAAWLAALTAFSLTVLAIGPGSLYSVEAGALLAVSLAASVLWLAHARLGRPRKGVATVGEERVGYDGL